MPFITFYTPTYRRPRLLADCVASIERQSDRDHQHLIITDHVGVGIPGVFAAVQEFAPLIAGEYVYFLQDDDILADEHVVRDLRRFVDSSARPPVVVARNRKGRATYPPLHRWGRQPQLGYIDLGSYIVRADVFKAHAGDFGRRYEGDFDFINALWQAGHAFAWYDRLIAEAQQIGMGKAETAVTA